MFATVCRHGSFSQAANELNIVQPALSRQIANLEAELGAVLVNRASRPIKPTAEGLFILERAPDKCMGSPATIWDRYYGYQRSKSVFLFGEIFNAEMAYFRRKLTTKNY